MGNIYSTVLVFADKMDDLILEKTLSFENPMGLEK